MIVAYVVLKVTSENRAPLLEIMNGNIQISRQFEGCRRFDFYQDVGDEKAFALYEEWDSQEAFDAYQNSGYFKEQGGLLFPLIDGKPSSFYYQVTPST